MAAADTGLPAVTRTQARRAQPWLGTRVEIEASADMPACLLNQALDAAFARIRAVHEAMSLQLPDSELSVLNTHARQRPIRASAELWLVLRAAMGFARSSHGAFDCTAGSPDGDWRDVRLLPGRRVRLQRAVRVDLGGIAKGYAVDCALTRLREAGVCSAWVDAGGDMAAFGAARRIGLRNPAQPQQIALEVDLHNAALASSGQYFQSPDTRVDGRRLLDPHGRTAATRAVSVRARDCLSADALTKIALFAPAEVAESLLARHHAHAWLLQPVDATA